MSEMKHTPGPWRACEPGSNFAKGKFFIRPENSETLIATIGSDLRRQERRGNAHLVAAAPDLLAALIAIRDATDSHVPAELSATKASAIARAAIAKVETP